MKALTLWQPWASLIVWGVKTIETRGWSTSYRGPLWIHAGQRWGQAIGHGNHGNDPECALCLLASSDRCVNVADVPVGALVGQVWLTDCMPIGGPTSFRTGIYEGDEGDHPGQAVVVRHPDYGHGESLVISTADTRTIEITDQLPYGDFRPGRYAWKLEDPIECEPVDMRGQQGLWECDVELT